MLRRVLAWILLAGFVLLLLNIMIFQEFLAPSIVVYVIIAVWFIFTNKPLPSSKKKKITEKIAEKEYTEE